MIGDSISAGFGMHGEDGSLYEFRGEVSTIGGDPGAATIPNFLKHYNPNLQGFSTGTHWAELPGEDHYQNDHLNAAQSGATRHDIPDQLDYLISYMTQNPNISLSQDWKVISFLLGANDVCPLCWDPDRPTPDQMALEYEQAVEAMIEKMYNNIPRLFLNIIPMFNVSGIYNLSEHGQIYHCAIFHDFFPFECPCAFDSDYKNRLYLDTTMHKIGAKLMNLANKWKAKNLPEFTVTFQPFTYNLQVANLTVEYISSLDCFHPSLFANQKLAVAGWNSLISLVKPQHFDPTAPLKCATQSTRLS